MSDVCLLSPGDLSSSAIHLSESGSDSDRELETRAAPSRGHQEMARMGLEQDESMMSYEIEGADEAHLEDSNVRSVEQLT